MLFREIFPDRWFTWTLVFLFVAGVILISYLEWVNLDMAASNLLIIVKM
ncbi:MAG: hypothetical protein AAB871_00650 [Patescibacteria group bacterium]